MFRFAFITDTAERRIQRFVPFFSSLVKTRPSQFVTELFICRANLNLPEVVWVFPGYFFFL